MGYPHVGESCWRDPRADSTRHFGALPSLYGSPGFERPRLRKTGNLEARGRTFLRCLLCLCDVVML